MENANKDILKAIHNITYRVLTKVSMDEQLKLFNFKKAESLKDYNELTQNIILNSIRNNIK